MSQYWFKPKMPGWGMGTPITWQGWVVTLFLIIFILIAAYTDGLFNPESRNMLPSFLRLVLDAFVLACIFSILFQDRIDGGLKWRWGKEQNTK